MLIHASTLQHINGSPRAELYWLLRLEDGSDHSSDGRVEGHATISTPDEISIQGYRMGLGVQGYDTNIESIDEIEIN